MKKRILLLFIALLVVQAVYAELKAEDFQVNPVQVQLGKTLTLQGYITNLNDEPVTGSATVYFKNGDKTYYDSVDFSGGRLEYSYTVLGNKPGEYSTDVLVKDLNGDEKLFENIASFTVVDEVRILVEPIQKKLLPGSMMRLSGEISTIFGEKIKNGVVYITLDDETYSSDLKDGKFTYDLKLSEKIKTGEHTLTFTFNEEETGNWGTTERTIYIEAIPTELKITAFQKLIKPEDTLEAAVYIYDQAHDEINDNVKVELTDADGKSIYSGSIEAVKKLVIKIPQYSVPGTWKLKASYSGLTAEQAITVEEVKSVEASLVNQIFYIKNTGNVNYNEPVSINMNGDEFVLTKSISLKPGEISTIDLTKETPSGQYDIKVTGAAVGANQFDNISIAGKNKRSFDFIYSILLILVITSLTYLTLFKKRYFKNKMAKSEREKYHARLDLKRLRGIKEKEVVKRPLTFSREQSISDFRERMLRDIKDTEEKMDSNPYGSRYRSSSSKEDEDDEKPRGLFNMFG